MFQQKFVLLFFFIAIQFLNAEKNDVLMATSEDKLGKYYYFLEDTQHDIAPQIALSFLGEGKFKKLNKNSRAFNPGFTESYFWLALKIKNETAEKEDFVYSFYNDGVQFSFYEIDSGKILHITDVSQHVALSQRDFQVKYPAIKVRLRSGETRQFLVHLKPTNKNNIYSTSDVSKLEDYLIYLENDNLYFGLFTGFLFFAFVVNILLFITLGEKIYLAMLFYLFFLLLYLFIEYSYDVMLIPGFIFKYFTIVPKNFYSNMAIYCGINMYLIFTDHEKKYPKFTHFIKIINSIFLLVNIILLVASLCLEFQNPLLIKIRMLSYYVLYISISLYVATIIYGIYKKNRMSYAYLLSSIMLLINTIAIILNSRGNNFLISLKLGEIRIGFLVEITLLTTFFIYKYKLERENLAKVKIENAQFDLRIANEVLKMQEEERRNIAQELHDSVGSNLSSVKVMMQNYAATQNSLNPFFEKVNYIIGNIYNEIRNISHLLMPDFIEQNTLLQLLTDRIDTLRKNFPNLSITLFQNVENFSLNKDQKLHIYRIICELLENAIKHSYGNEINLQLFYENKTLEISVEDNGKGIQKNENEGIGLKNIQSRVKFLNGNYFVESNKTGTIFIIKIPVL